MPLKLSLKPGEKFVVNGAVVANGDRRTTIVVQNKASILREKDILQIEDVDTPAKRIYFPIMMMYLDGASRSDYYEEFALRMTEFMGAIKSADGLAVCVAISKEVMAADYYKALIKCRKLIEYERERLTYVPGGVSADPEDDRKTA
ncbi:MAG: flagellar biosynthesis repressor FlbT [Pseudomonadota bacterium]